MKPTNLLILCGGISAEHKISLISARNLLDSLDSTRFNITLIAIDLRGKWFLQDNTEFLLQEPHAKTISIPDSQQQIAVIPGGNRCSFYSVSKKDYLPEFDVVFPVLHGPYGEDGTIQGLLKSLGIPYIGCDVLSSALCMDKSIAKQLMFQHSIPTSSFIEMNKGDHLLFNEVRQELSLPVFIKPANMGSSVGISKVHDEEEFIKAIDHAFTYDNKIIIEEFIEGIEVECAILGNHEIIVSEPGTYVHRDDFFDFDTKYLKNDEVSMQIPAQFLTSTQREAIKDLSAKVYKVLQCKGLSRIDTFVTKEGDFLVNEVNTLPGFTQNSMYAKLLEPLGLSLSDIVEELCELAQESS